MIHLFQSTPPHGGRRHRSYLPMEKLFNPRPRLGGDENPNIVSGVDSMIQSKPPHGGDRSKRNAETTHSFQIHARMGATPPAPLPRKSICFHPRPAWGRHLPAIMHSSHFQVSIHAPAWGATKAANDFIGWLKGFNPRPRMGGDLVLLHPFLFRNVFQSTPPHGGRRGDNPGTPRRTRFNPRPRMGGDDLFLSIHVNGVVSIHAPAWGATMSPSIIPSPSSVSIHAPAWGATGNPKFPCCFLLCFNPRPAGATIVKLAVPSHTIFNPLPRMGGDDKDPQDLQHKVGFNPAPAWGGLTFYACLHG